MIKPNIDELFTYDYCEELDEGWCDFLALTAKVNIPSWNVKKGEEFYGLQFCFETQKLTLFNMTDKEEQDIVFESPFHTTYEVAGVRMETKPSTTTQQ